MKRTAMGHSKLKKLCRLLSVPSYVAVGILESIWHLTAKEAPRGDIGKLTDDEIAIAIDYDGDPARLMHALVEARWVDRSKWHRLVIHDWHEHADDAVKKNIARKMLTFASLASDASPDIAASPDRTGNVGSSPDMSRNVSTDPDMSRLPEPEPEPEPMPEILRTTEAAKPRPRRAPMLQEWPATAGRIRQVFPATDDGFIVVLIRNAVQAYVDVIGSLEGVPALTDDVLARAVDESIFRGQRSAGPLRERVPQCIRTWAMEAKEKCQIR